MTFKVEKKGERFLVVNESTGQVRGNFREEAEAKLAATKLKKDHDQGIEMASARLTPPASTAE